jgi:anti-sigma factor RsiW
MNTPEVGRGEIDCEEAIRRLADFLDDEIDVLPRGEVEHHLDRCRSCFSRVEFEKGLRSRLRELRRAAIDPAFEERIHRLARSFADR